MRKSRLERPLPASRRHGRVGGSPASLGVVVACVLLPACRETALGPLLPPPEICDVVVSPASVTLTVGTSGAFSLAGSCSQLRGGMHWETADSAVAVVTEAFDSRVTITGRKPGTTSVITWPVADPRVKGAALVQVVPAGVVCTAELRPNIRAQVRDSVTGAAAASGAGGRVTSGGYDNVLMPFDTLWMGEGPQLQEHAGTYTVRISRPGYREWVRSDVVVTADECHVHTVELAVRLVPGT